MTRRIASLGLIAALLIVLTGQVCAACSDVPSKPMGCCSKTSHKCPGSQTKTPPAGVDCAAPAADLSKVEQTPLVESLESPAEIAVAQVSIAREPAWPGRSSPPLPTPDLCLLNSILTL